MDAGAGQLLTGQTPRAATERLNPSVSLLRREGLLDERYTESSLVSQARVRLPGLRSKFARLSVVLSRNQEEILRAMTSEPLDRFKIKNRMPRFQMPRHNFSVALSQLLEFGLAVEEDGRFRRRKGLETWDAVLAAVKEI